MNTEIEFRINFNRHFDDYLYYPLGMCNEIVHYGSAKNINRVIKNKILTRHQFISIIPRINNVSSLRCLKKLINGYQLSDLTELIYRLLKFKRLRYVKWLYMKHFDKIDWNGLLLKLCNDADEYAINYLLSRLQFSNVILKKSILACGDNFRLISLILNNPCYENISLNLKDLKKLIGGFALN